MTENKPLLDPRPYAHWSGYGRTKTPHPHQGFVFDPRTEYSQDEADYQ